ncbi:MAG: hypothetical protein GX455_14405 [Phycisphaerae bacterium]|nr:hypothetical protein [Phycisphaerae bacterium]
MYRLARQVRFSITPFFDPASEGVNSYASRPSGEGLCLFFGLWVELAGPLNPDTGFVINVVEIDRAVRESVVPLFCEEIRRRFGQKVFMGLAEVCELLARSWRALRGRFGEAEVSKISLDLNPYRKLTILSEDCPMFLFSEKFEFAATHKLWNDRFNAEANFDMFGKCANPAGHGHNYVLEVTVEKDRTSDPLWIADFQRAVEEKFITLVDHKNLNTDVADFTGISSVENLASFAWERLKGQFSNCRLHTITVWETDKTYCSYQGPAVV